jgi:hypothetical protein
MQRVELVAQDQAQGAHGALAGPARRQRAEQYFTASQSRAHLRRQTNGRRQCAQGLLGRNGFRCMAGSVFGKG